ncbi:MAG: lamin tail domain-containing protein, partial [Anaerolineaceae bacterium]
MKSKQKYFYILMMFSLVVGMIGMKSAKPVRAANPIRISQVYGGGGNDSAPFTHDFIEIFNSGSSLVSLAGMSIQYASATGDGNFGSMQGEISELPAVDLGAGQYYLIQGGRGNNGSTALPTPDLIDDTPIAMGATYGKVALVNSQASLGCNGGSTRCTPEQMALIVDLVGYGTTSFYEGLGTAPAPSNTTAIIRKAGGCLDTDDNAADFEALAPSPRNTASPTHVCTPATFPERFIISEYLEGSSNNKAIELYNGTGV